MLGHCLEQDSLLKGGRRRPPGLASAEWVENVADRKEVISVMNDLSQSILAKCMGTRDDEQYVDSSEVEEAWKPTGGTNDGSGAPLRRADVVVEVVPPPPEGKCTQDAEEANPLGPPGLVVGEGEQKDEPLKDVSVAINDFQ